MSDEDEKRIELIKSHIGAYQDFPKPGILFQDIFTALRSGEVCVALKEAIISHIKKNCPDIEVVCGLESRGFLFAFLVAAELKIACVPIRKKGKLPSTVISQEYQLEYGSDKVEIQSDSIKKGQKVLIIDDLIATGGTLEAARLLIEKCGGTVTDCLVVIELMDLKGREKSKDINIHSLIQY